MMTPDRIRQAYVTARRTLLDLRDSQGVWRGRLCASPLAGATALCAWSAAGAECDSRRRQEIRALVEDQNSDGGWGDAPGDLSNPAATLLAVSALTLWRFQAPDVALVEPAWQRGVNWVRSHLAEDPEQWAPVLLRLYDGDRTFPVPILATAAAAGLVPWRAVPSLPFELSVLPHTMLRGLRLGVVSYALPALIAIGLLLRRKVTRNPFLRLTAEALAGPALKRLERLQPTSGGFIEAAPLTAFVALSLEVAGEKDHPVAARALRFLDALRREDGRRPIDLDLACWVTSLAVAALRVTPDGGSALSAGEAARIRRWFLRAQWRRPHPYTGASPGGWGWTDTDGAVPDADDTAGALCALEALGEPGTSPSVAAGVRWLLDLQNSDGGWPTFCRGWQRLPFDRSAPALSAHVISALKRWRSVDPKRIDLAVHGGLEYLRSSQSEYGAWTPLWFGSPWTTDGANPVLGTALVLRAFDPQDMDAPESDVLREALAYLLESQQAEGGWGASPEAPETVEETGAVVAALARFAARDPYVREACRRGAERLAERVQDGTWMMESPVGLYFARLRYSERMYPVVWTVAALGAALGNGCVAPD